MNERPIYLTTTGGHTLLGFYHQPISPAGPAVALAAGGWLGTSSDRNRALVRMARALADDGTPVVRFDYHGVGDSDGVAGKFDLRRPFVSDLSAAVEWLSANGHPSIVPIGICFGARTAMSVAASCPESIAGLVLISCPLHVRAGRVAEKIAGRLSFREMFRRALRFDPRQLTDPTVRRVVAKGVRAVWKTRVLGRGPVPNAARSTPQIDQDVMESIAALLPPAEVLFIYGPDEVDVTVEELRHRPDAVMPASAVRRVELCSVPIQGFARAVAYDQVLGHVTDHLRRVQASQLSGARDGGRP